MGQWNLGIDFGTCNIKVCRNDKFGPISVKIDNDLHNSDNKVPNVIRYDARNKFLVGRSAKKSKGRNDYAKRIVEGIKRKLEFSEWKHDFSDLGFILSAEEITSDIFKYIRERIENDGSTILNSVVTVPVCFSEVQKQRILGAAEKAGINIRDSVTEPVAALFAIDEFFEEECDEKVLVFDFGGATLDLCLAHVKNDGDGNIKIKIDSSFGWRFGGTDIDQLIYEKIFIPKYKELLDTERKKDTYDVLDSEFLELAAKLKQELFDSENEDEEVSDYYNGEVYNLEEIKLTRQEVEECLNEFKFSEKIVSALDSLFYDSKIEKNEVTQVKVLGGTSRIPLIRKTVADYFADGIYDPDEYDEELAYKAVAQGAARYLSVLLDENSKVDINNSIAFYVGLDKNGYFERCIKRNQRYGVFTPRKPITLRELQQQQWRFLLYQSFVQEDVSICGEEGAVYMGTIELHKELYEDKDNIWYEFGINEHGKPVARFTFYDYDDLEEDNPYLIEQVEINLGKGENDE